MRGRIAPQTNFDAHIRAYRHSGSHEGGDYVRNSLFRRAVAVGIYDLTDPLDPGNASAVQDSTIRLSREWWTEHRVARAALDGILPREGARAARWTAGVELAHERLRRNPICSDLQGNPVSVSGGAGFSELIGTFDYGYFGERERLSKYGEVSIPVHPRWVFALGARHDSHDDVDSTVSGQLATRFHLNRGWSLHGALSYSEKPPLVGAGTATTIVTNPRVRDPLTGRRYPVPSINEGNPDLEAEETRTVSGGLSGEWGPVAVSADWYAAELSNVLAIFSTQAILNLEAQDPGSLPAGVRVVRNPPPAPPSSGSSESLLPVLAPFAPPDHIRGDTGWKTDWADMDLGVNWSYLRQYDDAASGLKIPYEFPRHRFRAVLGAERGQLRIQRSVYGRSSYWNLDRSGRYEQ